jgi:hypothetical protein
MYVLVRNKKGFVTITYKTILSGKTQHDFAVEFQRNKLRLLERVGRDPIPGSSHQAHFKNVTQSPWF